MLPTASGVLKHIQNTYECHQARIRQIKAYSVHVIDLELEDDGENCEIGPDISDDQHEDEPNNNDGTHSFDPTAFLTSPTLVSPPPNLSASVDVNIENDHETTRYVNEFPDLAGVAKAEANTKFERIRKEQEQEGVEPWAPFVDEDEWELARWLAQNVGQKQADNFLKLPMVRNLRFLVLSLTHGIPKTQKRIQPSYNNKRSLLEKIDNLPTQGLKWICDIITAAGDHVDEDGKVMVEKLELWRRDPVECVRELMENPSFQGHMAYAPERVYKDNEGKVRIYDEMWTANWWWDLQVNEGQNSYLRY